jgi:hypothetical protein
MQGKFLGRGLGAGGERREVRGEGCLEFLGGMQISRIDADESHP